MSVATFYTREAAEKFHEIVSRSGNYKVCDLHNMVWPVVKDETGRRIYKVICF